MNILFLTYNQTPNDGWSVMGTSISNQLAKKHKLEIYSRENYKKIFPFGFKNLKTVNLLRYWFFTIPYDVCNILFTKKNKPDIIHCNVEHYAPIAWILSKIYRVPYTITIAGTYGVLLPKKHKIYKKFFKDADKLIVISNYTKQRMLEEKLEGDFELITLGVDKNKFKINSSIKKEDIITFVGNLKPRKGLDFLLEAMKSVNKISPHIKLVVIGNIDFKCEKFFEIEKLINEYNLNIEFVGMISEENLIECYQRAKLNILPSKSEAYFFEGFGLIHVEANCCGTFTIGTTKSGNEDAILDGNGFLVDYGDVKDLSNKILDLFNKKDYPKIDMQNIKDWQGIALEYEELFSSLLDKRAI